jgi:Beta/Gamma crystallin
MADITIYEHAHFQGRSQVLPPGRYDDPFSQLTIGNDSLSSLKVPPGLVARLYEHSHFQGHFIDIKEDTPVISPFWNDRTSSIIVYGEAEQPPVIKEVRIFEHAYYGGSSQTLQKGKYDIAQLLIGNDTFSAAQVPYGMVLRLYEHANFQGAFIDIREDTPVVSIDWNDRPSSIVVDEAPIGLWVVSNANAGVIGESAEFNGIRGISHAASHGAVVGVNDNGGPGVLGRSAGVGVWGYSKVVGVWGESPDGVGVHAQGGRLAGYFKGDVEVTGDIRLANADCAEEFDICATEQVDPGTVMVLGEDGQLEQSHQAYDTRVAGVVSGAGEYKPGLILDRQESGNIRQPIALLGKVYCKVDAHYAPIALGDLLTTSPTPGHAMKATDPLKAFGAVLGKALRPFTQGQGYIPILVALQ